MLKMFGSVNVLNIRIKVFIGTSSLFQLTFFLLISIISCDESFSNISSSLTPSKSRHVITPFHVLRDECTNSD